jgi:hypothetical protein
MGWVLVLLIALAMPQEMEKVEAVAVLLPSHIQMQ